MPLNKLISISTLTALLCTSSLCLASHSCPDKLFQGREGFWYAYSKPGWKSTIKTKLGVTVLSQDFAGAIFSPKNQKVACVYKTSQGKWLTMVSGQHHSFSIQNQKNWRLDKKHHDYICGKPHVKAMSDCRFVF